MSKEENSGRFKYGVFDSWTHWWVCSLHNKNFNKKIILGGALGFKPRTSCRLSVCATVIYTLNSDFSQSGEGEGVGPSGPAVPLGKGLPWVSSAASTDTWTVYSWQHGLLQQETESTRNGSLLGDEVTDSWCAVWWNTMQHFHGRIQFKWIRQAAGVTQWYWVRSPAPKQNNNKSRSNVATSIALQNTTLSENSKRH